jgi:hypothetical protein
MKFYSYKGNEPLENAPVGTFGQRIDELKTISGIIGRIKQNGWKTFEIYAYTNFYDNKTFKHVYSQK